MVFEPVIIDLEFPVEHGGKLIEQLVFSREMVSGDLRGITVGTPTHDDVHEIASRITAIPTPVLKTMKMADYFKVFDLVMGFFNASLPTGGKP